MPPAARRLRLHDRIPDRAHVGRQPRAAHLRGLERDHEGTDRMVAMNCLHHLIEAQSARTPDADALAFEGERLTYRELERRANALAARLRGLGAGPEARVGLCVGRSLEMVVGILAVLKAGAAYVAMGIPLPPERPAVILFRARGEIVLAHSPPAPEPSAP